MSRKIVARDVAIIYRGKNGQEAVVACNGIDLEIETGTFVSIVGPSGCGKTTLLYALDGLLPIQRGEISVDGKAITGPGTDRAMVFQAASLLPWRTVLGQHYLWFEITKRFECRARPKCKRSSISSVCAASSIAIRRNCPAECNNVPISLALLPSIQIYCSSMNPLPRLTRKRVKNSRLS
jgi:ABC-type nitrate/sulfonate/bicarbonate transport system ATPase subunit